MVSWMHPEKKAVSRLDSDALVTQLPSNSQLADKESCVIIGNVVNLWSKNDEKWRVLIK